MTPERRHSKSDFKALKGKEVTQLVSDLKTIIQSLQIVLTRVEKHLHSSEFAVLNEKDDVQVVTRLGFRRQGSMSRKVASHHVNANTKEDLNEEDNVETVTRYNLKRQGSLTRKGTSTTTPKKDTLKRTPSYKVPEQPLFEQKITESKKPEKEEIVKSTYEPNRPSVVNVKDMKMMFEVTEEDAVRTTNRQNNGNVNGVSNMQNEEISVDVRRLKQKFEFERNDGEDVSKEKVKEEQQIRRKSAESNIPEEYEDKVKKILKYFQGNM